MRRTQAKAVRIALGGLLPALLAVQAMATEPPRFPQGAVWHEDISAAPIHPQSASMLSTLAGLGGWGNSDRFQIDFSIHYYPDADTTAPSYPVTAASLYYLPDCEPIGTPVPVPPDAAFEGQTGLSCSGGDCHLLIRQGSLLYEVFAGNLDQGVLSAQCLAVWNLDVVYPPEGRGEHCTSADAAGFPIAPLLVHPDAVAARLDDPGSDLGHAIRFILPNSRMASDASLGGVAGRLYVRPASHAGGPSGPSGSVPYGARLRLKADFDMSAYNPAEQVILRTMQRYGIVLADGGNIALTFASDRHSETSWAELNVDSQSLLGVQVGDFEVLDTGPRIGETYDCVRSPVNPFDEIFLDRFEF
ncbi:hypothetical protein [Wenzhouxiangella marina]|uniref:Uncharacterized protein n=1 Tax=Wenzhouxiangella marina TaxID=1579979 RepID=A0A0K0XXX8_9GAMM|nr:hypothetical protein [Wenzhouxiangella marina]AKS42466.1 hypothetical protein WM2015_2101 [Wenzhouxiangella marina]MBB6085759.1 serine/threonine-protein kinase [Wenzhouxiangella marina]